MITEEHLRQELARIERMKGHAYTDDQIDTLHSLLCEWPREEFSEAVAAVLRTHKWRSLPEPAHFFAAVDTSMSRSARTKWQEMAGSSPSDPGRPARIGEWCAMAYRTHDDDRLAYYTEMIDHMDDTDRRKANESYDATMREVPDNRDPGIPLKDQKTMDEVVEESRPAWEGVW